MSARPGRKRLAGLGRCGRASPPKRWISLLGQDARESRPGSLSRPYLGRGCSQPAVPVAGRCPEVVIDDSDQGEQVVVQMEHLKAELERLNGELERLKRELDVARADAAAHSDAARVVAEVSAHEVDRLRELLNRPNEIRRSLFRKLAGRVHRLISANKQASSA